MDAAFEEAKNTLMEFSFVNIALVFCIMFYFISFYWKKTKKQEKYRKI